jgi:hypothetical protein
LPLSPAQFLLLLFALSSRFTLRSNSNGFTFLVIQAAEKLD